MGSPRLPVYRVPEPRVCFTQKLTDVDQDLVMTELMATLMSLMNESEAARIRRMGWERDRERLRRYG